MSQWLSYVYRVGLAIYIEMVRFKVISHFILSKTHLITINTTGSSNIIFSKISQKTAVFGRRSRLFEFSLYNAIKFNPSGTLSNSG